MADNTLLKETLERVLQSPVPSEQGTVCQCVWMTGILMSMAVPQRQMAQLCMKTHTGQTQVLESGTIPNQLICHWAECPPYTYPEEKNECSVFAYEGERQRQILTKT